MSKRGVKTGAKMSSKRGVGYVELCKAILEQAKRDEGMGCKDIPENDKMWAEFIKTDIYKMGVKSGNVNSLDVANWVTEYLFI